MLTTVCLFTGWGKRSASSQWLDVFGELRIFTLCKLSNL